MSYSTAGRLYDADLRISTSSSGDTALLAATPGRRHRVHGLRLSVAGAVTVQLRSGSTVLETFVFAAAGYDYVLPTRVSHYAQTAENEALNLNLSAAVAVNGVLEYSQN